jgi:hypothetical protein
MRWIAFLQEAEHSYELSPLGGRTVLTIIQDNNATQEEASHSEQNWNMVLEGIKKLLE